MAKGFAKKTGPRFNSPWGPKTATKSVSCRGLVNTPVIITSHRGNQLGDHKGHVVMHHNADKGETWTFRKATSPRRGLYIESHQRLNLQDDHGNVKVHRNRLHWETWTIRDAGDGKVFITSHRNQQLGDHHGRVIMTPNHQGWEM